MSSYNARHEFTQKFVEKHKELYNGAEPKEALILFLDDLYDDELYESESKNSDDYERGYEEGHAEGLRERGRKRG